jgi:citrate lyase subunit beta / citryl-CoA lyase
MLQKAAGLPADQVFLDLEDAVAPGEKNDRTRENIVRALLDQEWTAPTRVVRVNAVGTPWFLDDITYVVGKGGSVLDCLMLPKVETDAEVHFVDRLLDALELKFGHARIGLELQIESPCGLVNIERIACASSRIETLIFGPGDYAATAGIPQLTVGEISPTYPGDHWHYVLSRIQTTARAFGLQAIDGPYAQIRDGEGFREVATRSRALGCDGKWALHPDQIAICNEIFAPSEAEFLRAQEIMAAYVSGAAAGRGAVTLDAEMVDEASRKMAEQVVARGRAVGLGEAVEV